MSFSAFLWYRFLSLWNMQVEVNTLTGETRILSSDLLYDSGKSLNPAVDIGQVNLQLFLRLNPPGHEYCHFKPHCWIVWKMLVASCFLMHCDKLCRWKGPLCKELGSSWQRKLWEMQKGSCCQMVLGHTSHQPLTQFQESSMWSSSRVLL